MNLGPFPQSHRGNKYILVMIDQFTEWVELFALPDQSAERTVVNEVIAQFGSLLMMHKDQGRNFKSHLFKEMCHILEITKSRTTPYHPASNGRAERLNHTLLAMIRCYVRRGQQDWDAYLPLLTSAYRRVPHCSNGFFPNRLMLGREVVIPQDTAAGVFDRLEDTDHATYVKCLQEQLSTLGELAHEHLGTAMTRRKRNHDLHAGFHQFEPGGFFYVTETSRTKGHSPKLQQL